MPFGRHTSAHAYQYDQGDDIYIGPNDEIDPDGGTIEMLKFTRVVFKCGILALEVNPVESLFDGTVFDWPADGHARQKQWFG